MEALVDCRFSKLMDKEASKMEIRKKAGLPDWLWTLMIIVLSLFLMVILLKDPI